jgi:hypothetical protein
VSQWTRTRLLVVSGTLEHIKQQLAWSAGQDGLVVALSLGRCTVTLPATLIGGRMTHFERATNVHDRGRELVVEEPIATKQKDREILYCFGLEEHFVTTTVRG